MRIVISQGDRSGKPHRRGLAGVNARFAPGMCGYILSKYLKTAAHQADCAVGVSTCASPADFIEASLQSCGKTGVHATVCESSHIIRYSRETEHARATLTCALLSKVAGNPVRFGDTACRRSECDDHPNTCRGPDGPELL